MISKAPDMKNNIFIVPPLKYIDFNMVFKVLLGRKVEKLIEQIGNRNFPKLNPMIKSTQKNY